MSLNVQQMGEPLASSGLHLKLIGFWVIIVLIIVLVGIFLMWRVRVRKRNLQEGTDDWRNQARPGARKDR